VSTETGPGAAPVRAAARPSAAVATPRVGEGGPGVSLDQVAVAAAGRGIRRVAAVAWRDLDHDDAGGSEVHLDAVLAAWAEAGLDVSLHVAGVPGRPGHVIRHGYRVDRRGGGVTGLLRSPWSARRARPDAVVEAWHGINFCGPVWIRGPRLGIVHHVHAPEFHHVMSRPAAWVARRHEGTVSPRLYRGTPLVALSPSVRDDLVALGYRPDRVTVVTPGVATAYRPGGAMSPTPRIVTVGRLWPIKRIDVVVRAAAMVAPRVPGLELVVVGEGPRRAELEATARELGAPVRFAGRLARAELIDLYRSAWVLATASEGEGWGMTITEAAGCATPAVVSDNAGHRHAVVDGVTGIVVHGVDGMAAGLARLLGDRALLDRMRVDARARAERLTWASTAASMLQVLVDDADRRGPG